MNFLLYINLRQRIGILFPEETSYKTRICALYFPFSWFVLYRGGSRQQIGCTVGVTFGKAWDERKSQDCIWGSLAHPSFKATLTGLRKTRLRKVQICPRLAETKRKNIFLTHMNGRICLGSPRYWLHKFDQNITKTGSLVIFWHPWLAAGTNNHLISLHHSK